MKSLVTGAAGFLGSHLCDLLLSRGHKVIGIDNLLTGASANLEHLQGNSDFQFIKHDICRPLDYPDKADFLFNMASPASPADFTSKALEIAEVNSTGTRNALEMALKIEAVFVQASTSECYGDPEICPQHEDYWGRVNCTGPRAVYDEGKRFSEALVMAYHRFHKLPTRIVRIFNTYGPRMKPGDGRALPNLMRQALTREPLSIYGDGMQTRSFCYVSDLIDGIYDLSQSDVIDPVNIGNPEEITILQLAQEILKLTDSGSKIIHHLLPVDDPKRRQPDISRAKALLGWQPKVSRQEGLRSTLDYFHTVVSG